MNRLKISSIFTLQTLNHIKQMGEQWQGKTLVRHCKPLSISLVPGRKKEEEEDSHRSKDENIC